MSEKEYGPVIVLVVVTFLLTALVFDRLMGDKAKFSQGECIRYKFLERWEIDKASEMTYRVKEVGQKNYRLERKLPGFAWDQTFEESTKEFNLIDENYEKVICPPELAQ